jgi:hypothetical protein
MRQVVAALLLALTPLPAAAEGYRLLMVEQPGCVYCERWHAEVGDAYGLSPEGRAAPLWPAMRRDMPPDGVTLARPVAFTPTFVLIDPEGQEAGRIEGYPGEDFFWGLLGRMLEEAGIGAAAKAGG